MAYVTWRRAQPLDGSILLKLLLQARLESGSFEPSMDFLAFLVQKLWPKNNKLIYYLVKGLINLLFLGIIFEPESPANHPKYQKTWILA